NIEWKLTGSGTSGILEATLIPDGFIFEEYYQVGQLVTLNQLIYVASVTTQRFVQIGDLGVYNSRDVDLLNEPDDLGESTSLEYEITSVTSNTITVTIPLVSSAEVVAAWAAMTNYVPISRAFQISSVSGYLEYTEDNYIPQGMWYREYLDMGFTTYELVDV